MTRLSLAAALLALLLWPTVGCQCYPNGTEDSYVISRRCGGMISAPSALQLATAVPSDCPVVDSHLPCDVSSSCLMKPSSCTDACFSVVAGTSPNVALMMQFALNPTVAPTFTLPDNRVTMDVRVLDGQSSTPNPDTSTVAELSVTGGSLSVSLTQNHFEAHFSLALMTSLGDHISVNDGTYVMTGETVTMCNTQN